MKGWLDTYPHEVHVSVLLLDGKLYDYKIGQRKWESPMEVTIRGGFQTDYFTENRLSVESTSFTVNNSEEHDEAFRIHAKEWLSQWEVEEEI